MKPACNVATLIERYLTHRLMRQRNVSPNAIASYKDTFRPLCTSAQVRLRKSPSDLALGDAGHQAPDDEHRSIDQSKLIISLLVPQQPCRQSAQLRRPASVRM